MDKPRTNFPKPYFGLGVCGKKLNKIKGSVGGWWARQDSNLQPDGYEPSALTS